MNTEKYTKCSECDFYLLCLATPKDHIDPSDGILKEIVGCDEDKNYYGRPLDEVEDYWRLKK